jgi:hypothetical protein
MTPSGIEPTTFRPQRALYIYIVTPVKTSWNLEHLIWNILYTISRVYWPQLHVATYDSNFGLFTLYFWTKIFYQIYNLAAIRYEWGYNVSSMMTSCVEYIIELNGGLLVREQCWADGNKTSCTSHYPSNNATVRHSNCETTLALLQEFVTKVLRTILSTF